jgi:hypothetical protein
VSGGVNFGNGLGYMLDFDGRRRITICLDLIGQDFDIHTAVAVMEELLEAHWEAEAADAERRRLLPRISEPRRPPVLRPTAVYRFFDRDGRLLYVGKALDPMSRQKGHEKRAWWPDVDQGRTTHEWFESERAALDAEDIVIRDEDPMYNRVGGGRR